MAEKKAFFTNEGAFFVDEKVKENSGNLVTSGAVYDAINGAGGAKEIVYFDVDPSDPPSGIYAAITEALSKNREPVIKNGGAVYFYSSTGTDKYVFVGGYRSDVVEYITITVSDDDSVEMKSVEDNMIFLVDSMETSPYESDDGGLVRYLKTARDNEYVTAEMVKAWIDSGKLLVIKDRPYVYYLTAYEDQGETESGRQYRLTFICNATMYDTLRRLVRTYLSENAGGYSTSRMRLWKRSGQPAWYNVSDEVQDLVTKNYINIESIDDPPSDIYLTISNEIPNGRIPIIRYNDAFYYFDKDYVDGDGYHTYSFVGKLDSDEWQTVIRVTSEGVTIGNVLGVNGTVANGVHNSFPLGGGKCGAESGDPDHPYLTFDHNLYASYATFNGNGGFGYVTSGSTDPVSVTFNGVTTTVNPLHKALVMVVGRHVVNPSNMPKGYILVEKSGRTIAAGAVTFYYGQDMPGIVEADGYYVLVLELTMNRTEELTGLLDAQYTVYGGFWVNTDYTDAVNGLANGPRSLATGQETSTALNNGNAAGALSLANGNDALAAAPYSVALHEESIAAYAALACGNHALALHSESKVLAAEGVSGRPFQTVLGRKNKLDPESAVVVGWINKNITKIDTDGYIFTGKRLDLANNIMPLYLMSDSDPDSPGTAPGTTGYWICDSQKQLVTAAEIRELYSKGMNFILYNNLPGNNSRTFWLNKSVISALGVDMEFVSTQDNKIQLYVVYDSATPEVTDSSLYVSSSETTYIERQWSREPETVTEGIETYAPVVNGVLALTQTRRIAKAYLKAGNMDGGTTFTVKVQKNELGEITDNIVYVVNGTSSTVTVSVKYQNDTMWSVGTITINSGYAGYVKINPMYFEVVNAGFVVFQ